MKRSAFGVSDIGRRRLSNEDAFLVDDALGLYVVADGMGGHNAGEVASGEAVDTLHGMVKREEETLRTVDRLAAADAQTDELVAAMRKTQRLVESAVQAATYMVFGLGEANQVHRTLVGALAVERLGDLIVARHHELQP